MSFERQTRNVFGREAGWPHGQSSVGIALRVLALSGVLEVLAVAAASDIAAF
jgi:hypothetical protein